VLAIPSPLPGYRWSLLSNRIGTSDYLPVPELQSINLTSLSHINVQEGTQKEKHVFG
jgi:hypothetical protein